MIDIRNPILTLFSPRYWSWFHQIDEFTQKRWWFGSNLSIFDSVFKMFQSNPISSTVFIYPLMVIITEYSNNNKKNCLYDLFVFLISSFLVLFLFRLYVLQVQVCQFRVFYVTVLSTTNTHKKLITLRHTMHNM